MFHRKFDIYILKILLSQSMSCSSQNFIKDTLNFIFSGGHQHLMPFISPDDFLSVRDISLLLQYLYVLGKNWFLLNRTLGTNTVFLSRSYHRPSPFAEPNHFSHSQADLIKQNASQTNHVDIHSHQIQQQQEFLSSWKWLYFQLYQLGTISSMKTP